MALPYATEDQLNKLARKVDKLSTGDGDIPTKLSELTNDAGFITAADLSEYALKTEIPDTSIFVTNTTLADYALKSELPQAGINYFALTNVSDADNPDRHSMMMKNNDTISGYATDGKSYNLCMVSR